MKTQAPQFLDLRQAEAEYPLSRRKLQQEITNGTLPAFRVGGKLILRRTDIERLLTAHPAVAAIDAIVEDTLADLMKKDDP